MCSNMCKGTMCMWWRNGNIFRVTGLLWGESIYHRWIPLIKVSDVELWGFLWSVPEQMVEQTFETPVIWDAITVIMASLWWQRCEYKITNRHRTESESKASQIAKFTGPTWGPPTCRSCRPQMGPMLAPWTMLSGMLPVSVQNGMFTGSHLLT